MRLFVEVAVNVPGRVGTFDYHLPDELVSKIKEGCLVVVPFGKQRVQGVVLRFLESPSVPETRPVEALLEEQPVLTSAQMELARWMARETLAPLSSCIDLMLPPGLSQMADSEYGLNPARLPAEGELKPGPRRVFTLLQERGPLRGRQIEAAFPRQRWKDWLASLVRKGLVTSRPVLPEPETRPRIARFVGMAVSPDELESRLGRIGRLNTPAYQRRKAALEFLQREQAPVEVAWVYAESGANANDLRRLADLGLIRFHESEVWRDPLAKLDIAHQQPLVLTAGQEQVWAALVEAMDNPQQTGNLPYLLFGVTGSGKTEIYLRAVAETLRRGRQAIVLVPEISLTPQTVQRFMARFPGQVGLIHSQLSMGERYDTWRRARLGQIRVIVGARSALFTPLADPGLIVVDECHDSSYYQSEPAPAYHAVQTALAYARIGRGLALLGSATPPVEWFYRFKRQGWPLLSLHNRVLAHREASAAHSPAGASVEEVSDSLSLPPVEIVDMRQELKAGNRSIFSRLLQTALNDTLQNQQQAILFLNRLGSASYVFCRDCGFTLRCPRCDRALTYHGQDLALICHTCNYRRKMPAACPQCGSSHIRHFGAGTERVVEEAQKLFPQARVLRWDSQAARHKGAHDRILEDFSRQRADVLVGTQMLAKGLDLPLVTLVGVVLADVGLYLDDFRAAERTFQLLTQVAGRAGRSSLGGKVIFQTFQPDHYAIQAASKHDYAGFYRRELEERRKIGYPPFSRLARLELRHTSAAEAERLAQQMSRQVAHWLEAGDYRSTDVIGPVPCFFTRLAGQYRWQIVLRGPDPAAVLRGRDLGEWRVEIDPLSLL